MGVTTGAARVASPTDSPAVAARASLTGAGAAARAPAQQQVPVPYDRHMLFGGNAKVVGVRVTDLRGATGYTVRCNGGRARDVSGLAKALYLLNGSNGPEAFRQRFIIA